VGLMIAQDSERSPLAKVAAPFLNELETLKLEKFMNFFRALKFALPVGIALWALILWAALSTCSHAGTVEDENGNKVYTSMPKLEYVFDAALAADMLTTLDIKNHPGKIEETNAILGKHPSDAKVITYGLACGAVHALITREMVNGHVPSVIVNVWEALSIGVEARAAGNNYRLGLRFAL
jgi:hypothetical protein